MNNNAVTEMSTLSPQSINVHIFDVLWITPLYTPMRSSTKIPFPVLPEYFPSEPLTPVFHCCFSPGYNDAVTFVYKTD